MGPSTSPKKRPCTVIPPPPNLHFAQCSQTNAIVLASAKPRLSHPSDGEAWFVTLEKMSPLLYSPVAAGLTQQHPTLCIVLGDVRMCCSAMETHSMKLSTHCSSANLTVTWSLEALYASKSIEPALSFSVAYHFVAEFLNAVIWMGVSILLVIYLYIRQH